MRWLLIFCGVLSGCQLLSLTYEYDKRSVTLLYGNLYDQKTPDPPPWDGDWLLRRERLLMVDQFLRDRKPDVAVFSQALMRQGHSAESDPLILGHGSLAGYEWDTVAVAEYPDTREEAMVAMAAGLPLQPIGLSNVDRTFPLSAGGWISFFVLQWDDLRSPVFVVEIRPDGNLSDDLATITRVIEKAQKDYGFCPLRSMVMGTFPPQIPLSLLSGFQDELNLKDIYDHDCDPAALCFTGLAENPLFKKAFPERMPGVWDRVFVHKETEVESSHLVLGEHRDSQRFMNYGLNPFYALPTRGYFTQLRLAQCDKDD